MGLLGAGTAPALTERERVQRRSQGARMADEEQQPIDGTPDETSGESPDQAPEASDPGGESAEAPPPASDAGDAVSDADVEQSATDAASAAADEAMAAMLAATQEAISQANGEGDAAPDAAPDAAAAPPPPPPPEGAAPVDLPAFDVSSGQHRSEPIDLLNDVHLNVRIELGRTRMFVEDVLKLGDGCVVELDKLAGDPVDVFVNDRCVAKGEVLVLNDQFCVRISEIVDPEAFEELEDSSAA